jgi:hypothetical protein
MKTIKTKAEAKQVFGGTDRSVAEATGVTRQNIGQLADELPLKWSDRLTGAAIRLGLYDKVQALE